MRSLLDINMLLALSDVKHLHHGKARTWRATEAAAGRADWATCPLTQNGFLRISAQPRYANPIPLPDAIVLLTRLTARPDHVFWPDDMSLLDQSCVDHTRVLNHRQLTDVYLLALAVKHGGRLVTLDTGISVTAVRGAEKSQLVMV
jgi:uncharacterized protein